MDAYFKQPDFIVTINGQDLTKDCIGWDIVDVDDNMCSITAQFDNLEGKYWGAFKTNDTLAIRFGTSSGMSAKVEMKLRDIHETNHTRNGLRVKVVAKDCTEKLDRSTGRSQQKGHLIKPQLDEIGKATGTNIDHSKLAETKDKPKKGECGRYPCLGNTMTSQQLDQLVNEAKSETEQKGGGSNPNSGDDLQNSKNSLNANSQETAAGLVPGSDREKNRLSNANRRAKSQGITANLVLVGYPLFRAKKCVTILGVGSKNSGKWYVRECRHSWHWNRGYITTAKLMRGSAGGQPTQYHADIYKGPNEIYAGPRQIDAESQATFTFGTGEYIVQFDARENAQTGRNAAKKTKGKTIKPTKAEDPIEEIEMEEDSGGDDGYTAPAAPTI